MAARRRHREPPLEFAGEIQRLEGGTSRVLPVVLSLIPAQRLTPSASTACGAVVDRPENGSDEAFAIGKWWGWPVALVGRSPARAHGQGSTASSELPR